MLPRIQEITESDFNETLYPLCLAEVSQPIEGLSKKLGLTITKYHDHDLGPMKSCFFAIQDHRYSLKTSDYEDYDHRSFIYVNSNNANTKTALDLFLNAIAESIDNLIEVLPELGQPNWILMRTDNSGNDYEIDRFHSEISAKSMQSIYTRRGHKQTYWVTHAA